MKQVYVLRYYDVTVNDANYYVLSSPQNRLQDEIKKSNVEREKQHKLVRVIEPGGNIFFNTDGQEAYWVDLSNQLDDCALLKDKALEAMYIDREYKLLLVRVNNDIHYIDEDEADGIDFDNNKLFKIGIKEMKKYARFIDEVADIR